MKTPTSRQWLLQACALSLTSVLPVVAQDDDLDNRGLVFRLGGGLRAGISADIRNINPVPVITPGVFDNGYVLPDNSDSSQTWNWGFEPSGKPQDGKLSLGRIENAPRIGNLTGLDDSPLFGGEIIGGFEMVRPRIGHRDVRMGFELGYGFAPFSVSTKATATSTATYKQAVYDLGGIVPLDTPSYHGTAAGPGPIISLNPIAASPAPITSVGTAQFSGQIDSDFHTFKAGVWFEVPLTRRFVAGMSLGLASIYASADLQFTETVTYDNAGVPASTPLTASVSRGDWRPGGYLQARLGYEFNRHLGVFVGADVQFNSDMEFEGAGRQVRLKFEGTYGATAGVSFRF